MRRKHTPLDTSTTDRPLRPRAVPEHSSPTSAAQRMDSASCSRLLSIGLIAVLLCVAASGCVRRRLLVRTNPPGALVYVDNVEVGTTPCAVNFTYYGTREIRLVKDGYETLTVNQPVPTPWYEFPPIDLISETMVPFEIRDERSVSYNLSPQMMVPREQLLSRAEQLRQNTHGGKTIPTFPQDPTRTTQPGMAPGQQGTGPLAPQGAAPLSLPQPATESLPPGGIVPINGLEQ